MSQGSFCYRAADCGNFARSQRGLAGYEFHCDAPGLLSMAIRCQKFTFSLTMFIPILPD